MATKQGVVITDDNFNDITADLLRKYAWDYRYHIEAVTMPADVIIRVKNKCDLSFHNDFKYRGSIPYTTFANADGLRDHIMKVDDDSLLGVVGKAGIGKSTAALTLGRYLDPTFTPEYVIFDKQELEKLLRQASKDFKEYNSARRAGKEVKNKWSGKVVVVDEGVYTLFSGDAMSRKGKILIRLFSIIRALGIIFIVCITNWRKISKGVKEDRFKGLFRIPSRGRIEFYSMKKINQIKYLPDKLVFPSPNFSEEIGMIDKSCKFWLEYFDHKATAIDKGTNEGINVSEADEIEQYSERGK